jgi:predicted nuclease with TOPRIM domain
MSKLEFYPVEETEVTDAEIEEAGTFVASNKIYDTIVAITKLARWVVDLKKSVASLREELEYRERMNKRLTELSQRRFTQIVDKAKQMMALHDEIDSLKNELDGARGNVDFYRRRIGEHQDKADNQAKILMDAIHSWALAEDLLRTQGMQRADIYKAWNMQRDRDKLKVRSAADILRAWTGQVLSRQIPLYRPEDAVRSPEQALRILDGFRRNA